MKVFEGDPVVLDYTAHKDRFIICGEVSAVDAFPPYKMDLKMERIENIKELRKHKRYFVSQYANLRMGQDGEPKTCIIKNISFSGVKLNCKEDIMLEDILDATIYVEKNVKFTFKGKTVRKTRLNDCYEYGLEIYEITETNLLSLHRFLNYFEFN
jgi:hypothetical protein